MKIFKLFNQVNGYASIDFYDDEINDILKGRLDVNILNGKRFRWHFFEDASKISDSPFYLGAFPIFEEKKVHGFSFIDSKIALFKVEGVDYIAVAAPIISGNIIDKEKSTINLFRSGKIMMVKKFALRNNILYPQIFRIDEYPLFTFVTEEMRISLCSLGLSQLLFEECTMVE